MTAVDSSIDQGLFRLDGRVALVTGASSGIGERCARALAAFGALVAVAARRIERLEALAAELHDAHPVVFDATDPASAAAAVDRCIDHYGKIDIVVNAAGITEVMPAVDETAETFTSVLATNLRGPFLVATRAARFMIDSGTGGSIVNISSIFGLVAAGQIPEAGYAASKGGLTNLTRELAAQWARQGVRVNAISPGWFRTEMTTELFESERGTRWMRGKTPMGRGGELPELDGALLLLASDAGSFITGQTITVDGGWTCI